MSKKRKICEENRSFQNTWENEFLFINNKDNKPQCLVCLQVLSVHKEYNIKRHYTQHHAAKFKEYVGEARSTIVSDFKRKVSAQKSIFTKSTSTQKKALLASFVVSAEIAKAKKPCSDGEFVKRCSVKMASALGEQKIASEFENVPLSKQTVTRRIEEIGSHLVNKLKTIVADSVYFSLALDESTDVTDTAQLLIFIRTVSKDFVVHEELLGLEPLHNTTKGQDIYDAVMKVLNIYAYGDNNRLSVIVTDGAKSMRGVQTGLVGLLRKTGINCPALHCIIHQEALCGKILDMEVVMKTVIKCVNVVKGGNRALMHRKFLSFLTEMETEYHDIVLFTQVRWLSRGNCLKRFFALRKEIKQFLEENEKTDRELVTALSDSNFNCLLAFLTDITSHMNVLNLKLQGRNQTISVLVGHLDGFISRLKVFKSTLAKGNFVHFPCCKELMEEEIFDIDFQFSAEMLDKLLMQFSERFSDFNDMRSQLILFNNPINCDISEQEDTIQLELCDLQSDPFFQSRVEVGIDFWKLVPREKYPTLCDFSLRVASMFGSTYICECTFSTMKAVKSSQRSRLTDSHLHDFLRISSSSLTIDFGELVDASDRPQCSH